MVPAEVVEMVPVLVVEIVPTAVVEIVPTLVVEMVPLFENAVPDIANVRSIASAVDFIFCIEFLLVIKASGAGSAREVIRLRSLSSWVDHLKILFGLCTSTLMPRLNWMSVLGLNLLNVEFRS